MSFSTRIRDAKKIAQQPRIAEGDLSWYGEYFVRYFSIYISYTFVKLRISANFVTIMSGVAGLCGSLCMVPHDPRYNLAGVILWQLWYILDSVDGEVARLQDKCSLLGIYLDEISHIIVNSTFVLALGLHVYFLEPSTFNVVVTIVIYSTWHWKREIQRLMMATLIVRSGLDKDTFVIKRSKLAALISRIMFSFRGEVEATLFISVVIIISHGVDFDFAKWSLYVYTVMLLAYVSLVMLRDVIRVHKKVSDL